MLVVVRPGGYARQLLLVSSGVVFSRKTLTRDLIDLLAELFGHGRGEVRVVAEGVGQLLERVEGFGRAVEYLFDGLVDVLLGRSEGRGVPRGHVGADRRFAGCGVVFRRLKRRGVGRREVLADGRLTVGGVAFGRIQRRRVSVLQLLAQHALALGGECLGLRKRCSVSVGHILTNGRFANCGVILRRLERRGVGCRKVFADGYLPSVGVLVRRGKRRGIPVLLLPAQHALALGSEGFGLCKRRSIARNHIFSNLRFPTIGVGLGRLKRRSVGRRKVPADGGVLLAELVDGFVGLFDVVGQVLLVFRYALFEPLAVGVRIFAIELVGEPSDLIHRNLVLGLVPEAVEQIRELLGRGIHAPSEPFAQHGANSDCHCRRVYLVLIT